MKTYNPSDWYWLVGGDATRRYSSARASYVPTDDADYVSWTADGSWPTRILNEPELSDVLRTQWPAGWKTDRYTSLEFMARFTDAEQAAIATAAQSNAQVLLFMLMVAGASYVDVLDPRTVAGVGALVTAGLLSAPRAAAILA